MAQQTINVGTAPNDGTGTPLRTAFQYTNSNFSELYTAVGPSGNNIVVPGTATITGDLTVDTSTLKVDSGANKVGIGTTTMNGVLTVKNTSVLSDIPIYTIQGATNTAQLASWTINQNTDVISFGTDYGGALSLKTNSTERYRIASDGVSTWSNVGGVAGTAMTLNSTGLGVGASPSRKLSVSGAGVGMDVTDTAQNTRIRMRSSSASDFFIEAVNSAESAYVTLRLNGNTQIDSSGNVGVGVTPSAWRSTQKALQIGAVGGLFSSAASTGSTCIGRNVYESTAGNFTYIVNDEATMYEQTATGTHAWYTASANTGTISFLQAMTLDASGNLLVGKTANYGTGENNTLQLKSLIVFASDNTGSASNRNWSVSTNGSAAGNMDWTVSSANNNWPNFAYRMQLTSAGAAYNTTGTWGTISDFRLKENISDARNYLADLLKLRVVKYSLKEEASAVATKLGLIAQEVEQVFPSLVEQSDVAYEGGDGIRTVKTSILVPMLLKAIQELTARVQTLETR